MKRVNDMLYGFIARSIEEKAQQDSADAKDDSDPRMDLISLYLDQHAADNGKNESFSPKKMRDFLVSFLAADQDTTSTSMSWFVVLINRYPEVLERVRQEIRAKLPDLASAIRETLRLFPVAPISSRTATRNVTMANGLFLVEGTSVHMPQCGPHYTMGRMENVWGPDAEEFKPERWIDPVTGRVTPVSPFKNYAFYGGPHACLGRTFAK